jgi:hypothetical protein
MIVRRRRTRNFTILENEVVEDQRLALDEIGLLTWLRSRPDDWEVSRLAIGKRFGIGKEKVGRIFRSLIECGWMVREITLPGEPARYVVNDEPGTEVEMTPDQLAEIGDRDAPKGVVTNVSQAGYPPTGDSTAGDPPPEKPPSLTRTESKQEQETSPTPPKQGGLESEDSNSKESEEALRRFDEFKRSYPDGIVDLAPARAEFMALSDADQVACIAGVAGYADRCRRRREKSKAGHLYIRKRVWENLAAPASESAPTLHPPRSPAGRAITILHRIAKAPRPLEIRGMISYRHAITPRLLALADAPPEAEWIDTEVGSNPNGAWRAALDSMLGGTVRPKLLAIRAPWIFPPGVDGKLYTAETATGPPIEPQMTEEDEREFTKGLSE